MSILDLTAETFDSFVQESDLAIVEFWAKWCGPCIVFSELLEKLSTKDPQIRFAKVDIEACPTLSTDFKIKAVPTIMIFRREFVVYAESGVLTQAALLELIEQAKKIDLEQLREQLAKN
jgi:thioredoxin 1